MKNFKQFSRRDFVTISGRAGLSTLVASAMGVNLGLVEVVCAAGQKTMTPFRFAILTDAHLFSIDDHKFDAFLAHAVEQVNNMKPRPDFVVYCGDIAQNGRDDQLQKGQRILSKLSMPVRYIPGEHDWYLDLGEAWRGHFGKPTWSFDHKGVHFIGMNSILVRDFWTAAGMTAKQRMDTMEMLESPIAGPWGVREEQLAWLKNDVKSLGAETPVVIFTHSPLWDYYPRWNFQTEDAPEIREILSKFERVMSFHGHVHQTVYNKIGNLSSVGTLSTSWPWPYPDVKLAYPNMRMNRSDPALVEDGEGTQHIDLEAGFKGTMHWDPFGDMLNPAVKDGFII
ncbi:MAG: metallophosphoesterase [Steroidobacteraceae bacterium]|jgi:3',5'-cyclic AMP phosphodiesterase CpdA